MRFASQSWDDETLLSGGGVSELGCDSLEMLQIGAAANEMFHLHQTGQEANLLTTGRFGSWLDQIEAAWATGVARLTFATSGSTGAPKRCSHATADLELEIDFLAGLFADRTRIVTFAPPHHIYGFLFGAMLPDRLGVACWAADCAAPSELATRLRSGDLVIAYPERWAWLQRTLPAWPPNVVGVTSTAPCPATLIEALVESGLGGVTEIYGSSETAGIGVRRRPDEREFRLMPHWRRGAETVYELVHRSGRYASLPDYVAWSGDRHFQLAGRRDGAVQIGGTNVYPERIARVLRQCPGVAEITVRLMRPEEGERLKAFVVPVPGRSTPELERNLREFVAEHLHAVERPTAFSFGATVPIAVLGKVIDW